jgi:NAD(P)H dehydrogenase (quinone)
MPKILVLFYSRTGHTARLADAIAEGARGVRFTEVAVRRISDLASDEVINAQPKWKESRDLLASTYRTLAGIEELVDYDGLIVGAPTRFGVMAAELKELLDRAGPLWAKGAFADKVGAAFATVQTPHGGHETTLFSIMTVMANLGMILVPPGYTDRSVFTAGSPYGATSTTGAGGATEGDLAVARHEGARVAKVTGWILHGKSHVQEKPAGHRRSVLDEAPHE